MAVGTPYFAWIDASETTFTSGHMRWDESVYSFVCEQNEGDPANLTITVKRPRNVTGDPIGLLGPGRKIWCWFSLDCGPSLFKFRGRLVGVPTSIFQELVTLEFIARPFDIVAQKEALAATLRVLPYYDEVVIDPDRRSDPEVVLEGYTRIWHYDRESLVLTTSDEISGEDGLVEFDGVTENGKVLYDGLGLTLTGGPLARVDVSAEFSWTQQAYGTVDLSDYLSSAWPPYFRQNRYDITAFDLNAGSWPKPGAGLGDGWTVAQSTAEDMFSYEVVTTTTTGSTNVKFTDGQTASVSGTSTKSTLPMIPPGSIQYQEIVTENHWNTSYDAGGTPTGGSFSWAAVPAIVPLNHILVSLTAAYTAERPFTELVSFSLFADVQHILTDPEDGEALRVDGIKSVNLSETIEGPAAYIPIGDVRRRSYIATERGNRSIEHLICLARAHLLKRARVVEITVAPKLSRMVEITLRKNALIIEPRIGEATGKIIGYKLALDGSDGRIDCEVKVGCTIGKGGTAATAAGTPTYAEAAYTGADYQVFIGRRVMALPVDSSVGYVPPVAAPDDDGLNFLYPLQAADVIAQPLTVENPAAAQAVIIALNSYTGGFGSTGGIRWNEEQLAQEELQKRSQDASNALKGHGTNATFKLKSMTREFSTPYEIQVTDVKIPTGYDLEAV